MSVTVNGVEPSSPAGQSGIKEGDKLLTINGNEIVDVLDYRFYQDESRLKLEIESADGKVRRIRIHKGEYEDLGLAFDEYLMDKQHSCRNKCIFCFIDQMPPGMRETLYFKDDDSRLSFLFGNYITLTNLSEHEISRIIKMHISPVNISVHTTNPALRCQMMNNRFAGECLSVLDRFNQAGIQMNCQLVLCPGYNDGEELCRTLSDLLRYENVRCIAAVPVGLTKYREGLAPLEPFTPSGAETVLATIDRYGDESVKKYGERRVYGADEFYLLCKKTMPSEEYYGDFLQLDNGVGMWSLFKSEAFRAVDEYEGTPRACCVTCATGVAAAPLLREVADYAAKRFPEVKCDVRAVRNDFFGERITVAGLVTGGDLIAQLTNTNLGERLLLPESMLRFDGDLFLDDVSLDEVKKQLAVPVTAVKCGGEDFIAALLGKDEA